MARRAAHYGTRHRIAQASVITTAAMALGLAKTIGVGVIGILSLYGAAKAMMSGSINLGGRGRDFIVSFAQEPGLFLFGLLFMLFFGVGALIVLWKQWSDKD